MPYGTARLRLFYGAGDYGRAMAGVQMTRGYYPGGGFFSSLGNVVKGVAGAVKTVTGLPGVGSLLKAIPVVGTVASGIGLASDLLSGIGSKAIQAGGVQLGPSAASVKQLQSTGLLKPAVTPAGGLLPRMLVEAGGRSRSTRRRRKRRASKRRSTGRTSRRRRRAGDYGDDWDGNTPSRAKGSGQFLTRAGGRRRHRSKRRRRAGQRVSFTTKSGKRVSFTAKGDGDDVA